MPTPDLTLLVIWIATGLLVGLLLTIISIGLFTLYIKRRENQRRQRSRRQGIKIFREELLQERKMIELISKDNNTLADNGICPVCKSMVNDNRKVKCPKCKSVLHRDCYQIIGQCIFCGYVEKEAYSIVAHPPIKNIDQSSLRDWWHEILRHGRYFCYAVILSLPSDTEVVKYLNTFNNELDLISGEYCLIIALSQTEFKRYSVDKKFISASINEHISKGHSLQIAKILKIKVTEFPCLVIFNDIRSSEYALISLEGLSSESIARKMREVFVVIEESISKEENPVHILKRHQSIEILQNNGWAMVNKLFNFGNKTFEKAMEAWIRTVIK